MIRKMLIDATHAEETRVVVVDGNKVDEFDFESLNKRQLAGNIYLAKVTRVEPSLQAAFVEYGGNRHGFLAFSEVHPDYYQIPKADREALIAEEAALAEAEEAASHEKPPARGRSRSRRRPQAASEGTASGEDAVATSDEPQAEEAGKAQSLDDVPPPSAASGEVDIAVPDEPAEHDDYEAVGGDDVAEERAPRKPRQRRYKIQEVIKVRQILLVQVVKEERGNKGAALTTYLSLAGRYCVLMPNTARGGGISRKITNAVDRTKLKDIANSITVPQGAGLIIRTAGAARTKTEIKRDYEFLLRQWEVIRDLTLRSIAPAPIYEEGSLIKRVIRDLYSRDIDEILVDGERGYREAKDYMKMLMPSHAKNVKHYAEPLPLFSRFQVESYLSAMFNPVVQLKSGGYIVIDVTEALVAVDVNSGRATRESSIEETALKTNLEAAEEAARQMRLRDLAGLIVIDFIDMDDRRNNAAVEKKLKEKLKFDRARIQLGRISGFGLLEMSRQRLRPGMIEATTKGCPHCHGTGRVRSDDSLALALLREIEEEGVRQRSKEVLIAAPVEICNYLLNQKREHIAMIEGRFGLSVRVEGDATLISPDYRIERFKTASRIIPALEALDLPTVAYPDADEMPEEAETDAEEGPDSVQAASEENGDRTGGKRKRRRRRRGGRGGEGDERTDVAPREAAQADGNADANTDADADAAETGMPAEVAAQAPVEGVTAVEAPAPRQRSRRRTRTLTPEAESTAAQSEAAPQAAAAPSGFAEPVDLGSEAASDIVDVPEAAPRPAPRRQRLRRSAGAPRENPVAPAATPEEPPAALEAAAEQPALAEAVAAALAPAALEPAHADTAELRDEAPAQDERPEPEADVEFGSESESDADVESDADGEAQEDTAPKRRGWWSRALGGS